MRAVAAACCHSTMRYASRQQPVTAMMCFVRFCFGAVMALLALQPASVLAEAAPRRIVSMNLCTDQLAMLIADSAQIRSVSHLAVDPQGSVMVEEAKAFPLNHGLAEEIFMMHPDLVLAGTFTSRATVMMLRRLKFRVEEFPPTYSFKDIREQIRRMGGLLGHAARAEALVAALDDRLAKAKAEAGEDRLLAALYYSDNYTSGGGTLAGEVVENAGLENLGTRRGLQGMVRLPLEVLVMSAPELVIGDGRVETSPALAQEVFQNPALRAVMKNRAPVDVPDKYWVCGTPFTAEAVRVLAREAKAFAPRGLKVGQRMP